MPQVVCIVSPRTHTDTEQSFLRTRACVPGMPTMTWSPMSKAGVAVEANYRLIAGKVPGPGHRAIPSQAGRVSDVSPGSNKFPLALRT